MNGHLNSCRASHEAGWRCLSLEPVGSGRAGLQQAAEELRDKLGRFAEPSEV